MNKTTHLAERLAFDAAVERVLERKRTNFLDDWDLHQKPSLVWQCWPGGSLTLPVPDDKLRDALRAGGGPNSTGGWWEAFRSPSPALVFDGLSSTAARRATDIGWVTEVHVDGYVGAGLWTFPECQRPKSDGARFGAADFYSDAFLDFASFTSEAYKAAAYSGRLFMTCTMHQADQLPLLDGHGLLVMPAPRRKTLQWPVVATDVQGLAAVGLEMAARFLRVYGRNLRSSR